MRRAIVITLIVCAAVALVPPTARAQAPVGANIVFRPRPGTVLTLEGRGSFRGSLELKRERSDITVINDLSLDDYVAGVREVPARWPMEALKAQAVAARTYVLWELQRGYWQRFGFDVCGTTSCQVYRGVEAETRDQGERWVEAVRATSGQVLLADGKPALTRYHSSSGGRTLPNEVVFPENGPLPYLRAVDDPADVVSPLHTWKVEFTRRQLELVLRVGIGLRGTLSNVVADEKSRKVTVTTLGGQLTMSSSRFRSVISGKAPLVYPSLFPAERNDGRRMPFTLPSSRFTVARTRSGFLVRGRGYGHGVGMSQWGAMGLAARGHDYTDILATYYPGLRPQRWKGQQAIRVAVVRGVAAVRISGDGPFGVYAGNDALASSTLGGWSVGTAGDRSLGLSPPRGHSLPLVLTGVRAPTKLIVDPPDSGARLDVDFVVPKPAEVVARLSLGGEVIVRKRVVVEAGERRISLPLDPSRIETKATYRLDVNAIDGTTRVSEGRDVLLVHPRSHLLQVTGAFAVLALLIFVFYRRRRRPPPQSSLMPERGQLSPDPHG